MVLRFGAACACACACACASLLAAASGPANTSSPGLGALSCENHPIAVCTVEVVKHGSLPAQSASACIRNTYSYCKHSAIRSWQCRSQITCNSNRKSNFVSEQLFNLICAAD
ncbi:hypothetical protein GGI42DRAFT_169526 [Trichoderma sp. SZMC 28013]